MSGRNTATPQPKGPPADIDTPPSSVRGTPARPVHQVGTRTALSMTSGSSMSATPARPFNQPGLAVPSSESSYHAEQGLAEEETFDLSSADVKKVEEFRPYNELLKTVIRLEYGQGLDDYYLVHLEMLNCYSKDTQAMFYGAEPERLLYEEMKNAMDSLKDVILEEISAESFSDDHANQAMEVVHWCLERFPFRQYQAKLSNHLTKFAEENLFNNSQKIKGASSNPAVKKAGFRDLNLKARLKQLNANGIRTLAFELHKLLNRLWKTEQDKARTSRSKAAAQQRIILSNFDHKTARSVVEWIYQGNLNFDDAADLCKIYGLADDLGITDLAATCMSKLTNAAHTAMDNAFAQGISLLDLLKSDQAWKHVQDTGTKINNVVRTVFEYVLNANSPPAVLQKLVIKALADSGDRATFQMIKPMMSHTLALELSEALMAQAPASRSESARIKTESPDIEKTQYAQ